MACANPLRAMSKREPDSSPLFSREPVSTSAFADWPVNVVFQGGSQSYGLWVPQDGAWYNLCDIQCLDLPAYATGACCYTTVDRIGVGSGYGPCSFVGANGWTATITGNSGYYTVGPPQTLVSVSCS